MPDARPRRWQKVEVIGQVLREVLHGHGLDRSGRPDALRKAWLDAVGRDVGGQTRVTGLRHGVLVVEVESAVLRQELALYRREAILLCLRGVLEEGTIRDIQFRAGKF
ncbi:MAG: DUF721 domain-containing protein [Planctomycetes bacterium]|nr:DUF721 domain-containing protein [Planctomycetota bacterium]